MRLLDTSAWVEWLVASPVGLRIAADLPPKSEWIVPTIVQFELARWLSRVGSGDIFNAVLGLTGTCLVVEIDTALVLAAAELGRMHKLAMAGALIYATARAFSAELITCDRHFEGLAGVRYLPKT